MSVANPPPSVAAADSIGLLDDYAPAQGHPEGWLQAVLNKMENDNLRSGGNLAFDRIDQNDYTPEEYAAWKWYRKETSGDSWARNVADHNAEGVKSPDTFVENKDYAAPPQLHINPPEFKTFNGDAAGAGTMAVSTAALNHFVEFLRQLAPAGGSGFLMEARDDLVNVNPRPGAFAVGTLTREVFVGDNGLSGLAGETATVLNKIQAFLFDFAMDLGKIAKDFEDTEELNALTADKFKSLTVDSDGAWGAVTEADVKSDSIADR
ncbi:hypothetical protein [Paractinoplanes brasiliensis]|uniref:Uncharacterized protein n=1 Tax=Paractinoplanes brasiliensis TaxID=52695 RepID=A0A4V3C7B9_9ACTN|nr:hypothetical protein [Actinoplanes brasiliensis]TDO37088.1 hypothetical protein C8E87_0683 [Actinoplanes brasiliensis]GID32218.1 hypothetical protein Abr02nite_72010 [Actinoplanes brasiliensis]